MEDEPKGVLLLTGTVGTGKTTVAAEIGEQLADIGLPNAVIDLDWLGWVNAGDHFHRYDQLIMQNLISVWPNYRAIGVEYLVLARGLIQHGPLDLLTNAFPSAPIIVVRLVASKETIKKRLSQRDSGETLREHLNEVDEMNRIMDDLHLEDATVVNDDLSVQEISGQIIHITGWRE